MNSKFLHKSVMPDETLAYFSHRDGQILVDCTAGGGGHLKLLADLVGKSGKVIAFDQDPRAHQDDAAFGVAQRYPHTIKLFHRSFSQVVNTLIDLGISQIDGLICDLGVSSHQLDDASRGFSFMTEGPIDMRMNSAQGISAYEWLEHSRENEIADTLYNFAGERKSRQIAAKIKQNWPIENSTLALAKLVLSAVRQKHWSKIHPATRTFQAIRMAVNGEVNELTSLLNDLPKILAPGGVAVFLSFHSVEDRLIKNRFRELAHQDSSPRFKLLNKKPAVASEGEINDNRRSRSAKLRAIKRET